MEELKIPEGIPPELREKLEKLKAVAESPDLDSKWKFFREMHFSDELPPRALQEAKRLFYSGAAAMMACAKDGPIPEDAKKQCSMALWLMAREDARSTVQAVTAAVNKLAEMLSTALGRKVEVEAHEVDLKPGQSMAEAVEAALAEREAQHAVKH